MKSETCDITGMAYKLEDDSIAEVCPLWILRAIEYTTMNSERLNNEEWVNLLFQAQLSGNPSPVCSSRVTGVDQAIAYSAQAGYIKLRTVSGRVSGFKGALTNKAAQKSMGIDVPVSGVLLEEMHLPAGSVIELENFCHAVVETEVGSTLNTGLQ